MPDMVSYPRLRRFPARAKHTGKDMDIQKETRELREFPDSHAAKKGIMDFCASITKHAVTRLGEKLQGIAQALPSFKRGAAVAMIVAALAFGAGPEANAGQKYRLTPQQIEQVYTRIQDVDIQSVDQVDPQDLKDYMTFRALEKGREGLKAKLNGFGYPDGMRLVRVAKERNITGKVTPELIDRAVAAVIDAERASLKRSMGPEKAAEADIAMKFDYVDDYLADVERRWKKEKFSYGDRALTTDQARVFVRMGKAKKPGKNVMNEADIRRMWAFINSNIERVYENPEKAAVDMRQEIDTIIDTGKSPLFPGGTPFSH